MGDIADWTIEQGMLADFEEVWIPPRETHMAKKATMKAKVKAKGSKEVTLDQVKEAIINDMTKEHNTVLKEFARATQKVKSAKSPNVAENAAINYSPCLSDKTLNLIDKMIYGDGGGF